MKRAPLFYAALGLLVVSNAFVLVHAQRNRAGEPESEMELTERELRYYPQGKDDSSLTMMLLWQNPVAEYRYQPVPTSEADFFDGAKLKEIGFDLRVAPDAKQAERFYSGQRSREVFVALEYDGPAWQEWLKWRAAVLSTEVPFPQQKPFDVRLRIERETTSRLVAVDVALDPARLREKFPDRKKVMILSGRARVVRDGTPPALRGAITSISTDGINVPNAFRPQMEQMNNYAGGYHQANDGTVIIDPPGFAATIRVGSKYEPWVAEVRKLR